jgi:hypothetical protein
MLLLLAAWAAARMPVSAQQAETAAARPSLSLELDPAPFLLNGYSFSLRFSTPKLAHWSAMASVFAADLPDGMIPEADRDAGFSGLRFKPSHALFVDYTFRDDGRGFYCGPSVFLYDNRVHHDPSGTEHAVRTIYPNLRVGYTCFPFRRAGLYLSPWVNVGNEMALDARDASDGPHYEPAGFKYIVAVHVGYRYDFR